MVYEISTSWESERKRGQERERLREEEKKTVQLNSEIDFF